MRQVHSYTLLIEKKTSIYASFQHKMIWKLKIPLKLKIFLLYLQKGWF